MTADHDDPRHGWGHRSARSGAWQFTQYWLKFSINNLSSIWIVGCKDSVALCNTWLIVRFTCNQKQQTMAAKENICEFSKELRRITYMGWVMWLIQTRPPFSLALLPYGLIVWEEWLDGLAYNLTPSVDLAVAQRKWKTKRKLHLHWSENLSVQFPHNRCYNIAHTAHLQQLRLPQSEPTDLVPWVHI